MDVWALVAERKIQEAIEEGAFDNLDGAGKPLDLSENPFEDPSQRMANRILRNNGLAPGWIQEAKELDAEFLLLRVDGESGKPGYEARVKELNRKILLFNLKAPKAAAQRRLFEAEE